MELYIVSVMKKSGKTVGYVTVDVEDNNKVKVISRDELITRMKYGAEEFENVKYSKDKILGKKYNVSILPVFDNKDNSLLALYKTKYETYILSDSYGRCKEVRRAEIYATGLIERIVNKSEEGLIQCDSKYSANSELGPDDLIYDTMRYPDIDVFDKNIIEDKSFKTIIINDNIRVIGNVVGSYCNNNYSKVRRIVISDKVQKIDNEAFYNTMPETVTFYVVEGSIAHQYCLNKRHIFKIINKVSDIYDVLKTTPENVHSKFRMLLSGTEYDRLLANEYINNIEFIYKLEKTKHGTGEIYDDNIRLNTSKFIEIDDIYGFNTIYDRKTNERTDKMSNRFKVFCNLITTLFDNNKDLYGENFINNSYVITNKGKNLFVDGNNSVFIAEVYNKILDKTVPILEILINNKIVFQTLFKVKTKEIARAMCIDDAAGITNIMSYKNVFRANTIADLLVVGDIVQVTNIIKNLNARHRLHDIDLPDNCEGIQRLYKELIEGSLMLVGRINDNINYNRILALDLDRAKFIEFATFNDNAVITLRVIATYDFSEFNKLNNLYFWWVGKVSSKEVATRQDKELTLLKARGFTEFSAYTKQAVGMVAKGAEQLKKAIVPFDVLSSICMTELVEKIDNPRRCKATLENAGDKRVEIDSDRADIRITQHSTRIKMYGRYAYIIETGFVNRKSSEYFMSVFTLPELIDILYTLANRRHVDNSSKNIDNYVILLENEKEDLKLAISKDSFDPYILVASKTYGVKHAVRYDKYKDAITDFSEYEIGGTTKYMVANSDAIVLCENGVNSCIQF